MIGLPSVERHLDASLYGGEHACCLWGISAFQVDPVRGFTAQHTEQELFTLHGTPCKWALGELAQDPGVLLTKKIKS